MARSLGLVMFNKISCSIIVYLFNTITSCQLTSGCQAKRDKTARGTDTSPFSRSPKSQVLLRRTPRAQVGCGATVRLVLPLSNGPFVENLARELCGHFDGEEACTGPAFSFRRGPKPSSTRPDHEICKR